MMSKAPDEWTDRIVRSFVRYERFFGILGIIWLAMSSAAYARFLSLPKIPYLTDELALYLSAAYNAGWWGFLRPAIERRKSKLFANPPDHTERHRP